MLRPVIGESLFLAEGRSWLWQKRAASPVFSRRNISSLGPVMTGSAARLVERLRTVEEAVVDMHSEFTAATFEVISDVMFAGQGCDRPVCSGAGNRHLRLEERTDLDP